MSTQITKRALLTNRALSAGLGVGASTLLAQHASADSSFTRCAFPATGAPTPRTMPDRPAEINNVKDFGAVGDGVHDDTAAIQSCLDAAFGPASNFNGLNNAHHNKQVYFPPGKYVVSAPQVPRAITNVIKNANGTLTYTTRGNHGFVVGQLVFCERITCDGDLNGLRKIGAVTPNTFTTVTMPAFNSYIGGGVVRTCALSATGVYGGKISGNGAFSTQLINGTPGGIAFTTNGWKSGVIEGMGFVGGAYGQDDGVGFNLDLDGDPSHSNGIQGVCFDSFYDCFFTGFSGGGFGNGCQVAPTNYSQGDTIFFNNCIFTRNHTGCRLGRFRNMNCINVSFYGGNFMTNDYGIYSDWASLGKVDGALFEESNQWDIYQSTGAQMEPYISGCTSESTNFCYIGQGQVKIDSCNQRSSANGTFLYSAWGGVIDNCYSRWGQVRMWHGGIVRDSQFLRTDAIKTYAFMNRVYVERCMIGATSYSEGASGSFLGSPNYIKGFFINGPSGVDQWFIGEKRACVSIGPNGKTFYAMRVGDLPPAGQDYTKGISVTVFDAVAPTVGAVPQGGGNVPCVVFNNGTNWHVVAV
jgi:pectate lyase-like protein